MKRAARILACLALVFVLGNVSFLKKMDPSQLFINMQDWSETTRAPNQDSKQARMNCGWLTVIVIVVAAVTAVRRTCSRLAWRVALPGHACGGS
jgi:hypothetical protein